MSLYYLCNQRKNVSLLLLKIFSPADPIQYPKQIIERERERLYIIEREIQEEMEKSKDDEKKNEDVTSVVQIGTSFSRRSREIVFFLNRSLTHISQHIHTQILYVSLYSTSSV